MNGTSYRFLDEQRHQFGTGSWLILRTHDLIALSRGISIKREKFPGTIFMLLHLMLILVAFVCTSPTIAADMVPLNSGPVEPSKQTTDEFLREMRDASRASQHGLAMFSRHLTQAERKSLARIGVHVLEHYQKTTYWVKVDKGVNLRQAQVLKLIPYLIRLHDEDRVNPQIWRKNYDAFRVRQEGDETVNYVLNDDGTLKLTVRFHADVTETQARKVLRKNARTLTRQSDVVWVVVISSKAVQSLAKEDLVQWIDAGPLPFLPNNDKTREAIKVDAVQSGSSPGSLLWGPRNGSGVRIGIFEKGIDERHPDFIEINDPLKPNRVTIKRPEMTPHGTQIAATVAANGQLSAEPDSKGSGTTGAPFQWRGMAPSAVLFDESWSMGADEAHYRNRIQIPGMQLSNHSHDVSHDGYYSDFDKLRDGIIRGTVPGSPALPPRLHVYSAGNLGEAASCFPNCEELPFQSGYFSLTKQVKNGLVVGNWNYWGGDSLKRNQIFVESSLGPAHDGRIKPDVVAPGTEVWSSTTYTQNPPYYGGASGTSSAAAAVTGSLALVLQQYAITYLITDLNLKFPLPSTLRAVMIHTAKDIEVAAPWFSNADGPVKPTLGPDFVTGWGLVNAENAREVVAKKLLYEDTVDNECETKTYTINVTTTDPIRVTLAWDDPSYSGPTSPIAATRLVNDLDLILIDPNSQPHYSWKLDQKIVDSSGNEIADNIETCPPVTVRRLFVPTLTPRDHNDTIPPGGIPSAVRGRDHLNNVEVVDVEAPAVAGVWRVKVIGFSIAQGPQPFSLVGQTFSVADMTPPAVPRTLQIQ